MKNIKELEKRIKELETENNELKTKILYPKIEITEINGHYNNEKILRIMFFPLKVENGIGESFVYNRSEVNNVQLDFIKDNMIKKIAYKYFKKGLEFWNPENK